MIPKSEKGGGVSVYALPLLGLFFILTVAPMFFTVAMRDVFTLPKALPISIGVAVLWVALSWVGEVSFERALTPGIIAISAVTLLTACFSADLPLSILGPHQQQFYAILPMSLYVLTYYAAANAEGIPPSVLVTMALFGGGLVAALAISQVNGGGFMPWSIQGGRSGSTFGTPIFLGSYLSMLLPLAWLQRGETKWPTITGRVDLVMICIGLLATRSRGSILAAGCGVLLIELLRSKHKIKSIAIAVGVIIPLIAIVAYLRQHVSNGDGNLAQSNSGHMEIWRIAVMAWHAHPIFGWGPDAFSLGFRQFMTQRFVDAGNGNDGFIQLSAHNDILQVLSTMGIAGLAAYTFFIVGVVKLLRNALRHEPEALGIAGAMAALFVSAKFNPIPLAALAVAAGLLGSLDRWPVRGALGGVPRPRTPAVIATALSVSVLALVVAMCNAERHQRIGENMNQMGRSVEAAEQFNIAAQINPFDLWYTQKQIDYFWLVIPNMPGINKMQLAAFSHNISENIGRLHPLDPTAHELRALSYRFEGSMIGHDRLWEADHEMGMAIKLAPNFRMYKERLEEIQRLAGVTSGLK